MNLPALVAIAILLSSCASLNPYSAVVDAVTGKSSGYNLELKNEKREVHGENNEKNVKEVKLAQSETKQSAKTIVNNYEMPVEFFLLSVIGWLLPSPNEIWRGFLNLFKLRVVK